MARLDVYSLLGAGGLYVVDVQADLLFGLSTRTVVPLVPDGEAPKPISELNPKFDILGKSYVLVTQSIASISKRELVDPIISLGKYHDQVTRALDTLLIGF